MAKSTETKKGPSDVEPTGDTGERHEASEIGPVPPPPHDPPPPGVEEKTAAPTPYVADNSFAAVVRARYFVHMKDAAGARRAQAGLPNGKAVDFVDGVAEIEEEDLEHFMDESRFGIHFRP